MVYQQQVKIGNYDCDSSGGLRPSAAMRVLQQTSQDQLDAMGIRYHMLLEKQQVFLLTKTILAVEAMPKAGEAVMISTAAVNTKGVRFYRDFVMDSLAGERLVSSSTQWILVDPKTRKVLRPKAFAYELPFGESLTNGYLAEEAFLEIGEKPDDVMECPVFYSHIDTNHHVNNTFYLDFACNVLPVEVLEAKRVKRVEIEYQHEAVLGDIIVISRYDLGEEQWYIDGKVDGACCFRLTINME